MRKKRDIVDDALNFGRTILETSPVGVIIYEAGSGKAISANPAAARLTGATIEQLLEQNFRQINTWKTSGLLRTAEAALGSSSNKKVVTHFVTTFGKNVWLDCQFIPFLFDQKQHLMINFTDISEHKALETALRKNEIFNRSLVDHLPYRIFIKDRRSIYLSCNATYAKDLGVEPQAVVGKDDFAFHPKKLAEAYRADDQAVMISGEVKDIEEKYVLDGKEKWIHTIKVPFRDENSVIMGVLGIFEDVTERKQAADALRESEERYRALFESMLNGFAYCQMIYEGGRAVDFVYLEVNQAFETLTGLKNAVGKKVTELIPGIFDANPEILELYARVSRSGKSEFVEYPVKAINKWFAVSIYSPKRDHFVAVFDDITQRKKSEEELRQSEERFRQLAENIKEVFYISDLQTTQMLFISPAYESVWGRKREEVYKDPRSFLEAIHPDDRHIMNKELEIQKIQGIFEAKYRVVQPNGNIRWIHDRGFPILDKDGNLYRVAGIAADITDTVNAQNQLIRAEKMAALGQMAAGIVHEIKNPIAYVSSNFHSLREYLDSYLQLIQMGDRLRKNLAENNLAQANAIAKDIDRFKAEKYVSQMLTDMDDLIKESQEGLDRVKRIIVDLKSFAREDQGEVLNVALEDIIKGTLNIVRNEIKHKCALNEHYAPNLEARCNPQTLGQVLLNLIINAAQAIEQQGTITLRTYRNAAHACIDVEDDGCGIAPEVLPRIFDPFFTTKPTGQGTGLGLSISYDIIKKSDGDIKVRSAPGKGTTFTVYLPANGK